MATNYDEKRADALAKNQADEKAALNEVDVNYGNMIAESQKTYQDAINKVGVRDENGNWNEGSMAQIQTDLANKNLDFAIDEIEQKKQQAHKDYTKEQSGAYVDWQKQSNRYGANAEQMAASGLAKSGYSESSQVSMYNTYQNRLATAREAYTLVKQNYDRDITNARLQNDATLAQIAFDTLTKGLELTLEGFQYKNQLILDKAKDKLQIQQIYQDRWKDTLDQINRDETFAWQKEQAEIENKRQQKQLEIAQAAQRLDEQEFAYKKQQDAAAKASISKSSGSNGSSSSSKSSSSKVSSTQKAAKAKGDDTYNKAANEMKKSGAISAGDGGLMTKTEWKRRKASGSNRAETSYATYAEYVAAYTAWRKANPEK